MPRKENTKARTWERDRRERMNAYFKTLADLLPPHQDGRKRNKVDILIHAAKYIKDLHGRTEELFHAHASEVHKEELVRLKKLVSQLFSRTQLLSTLLKEAGISIPAEPAIERVSAFKWSNKINVEDSEKLLSRVEEKKRAKKKKEKIVRNKVPSKRKSSTSAQGQSKKLNNNNSAVKNVEDKIEDQENRLSGDNNDNKLVNETINNDSSNAGQINDVPPTTSSKAEKLDSPKKVKRKSKTNQKNKIIDQNLNQSVTNLASGTLILSGGKIMPVVTPITPLGSNIIVNARSQSSNPIILSNAQPNQMIVMQHLPNPGQNSVIPVCNQTLINAVQKVTLNQIPNIQTNIVVSSQDWVSNVKSIINATKISGKKCILPKGREITKTTMTYKVPIPAVHKEKLDKSKEIVSRKDGETKSKSKNGVKGTKNQQNSSKLNETVKTNTKSHNPSCGDKEPPLTLPAKRSLTNEFTTPDEPDNKKSKGTERLVDLNHDESMQLSESTSICKSIESLRHVIQKIGTDMNDSTQKNNVSSFGNEKNKVPETNDDKLDNCKTQDYPTLSSAEENSDQVSSSLEADDANKLLQCQDSNSLTDSGKGDDTSVPKPSGSSNSNNLDEAQIPERQLSMLNEVITTTTTFSEEIMTSTDSSEFRNEKSEVSLAKVDDISSNGLTMTANASDIGQMNEVQKENEISESVKAVCNLGTRFDSLLQANDKGPEMVTGVTTLETSKIILNLDTNTTTTVKPDSNNIAKPVRSTLSNEDVNLRVNKLGNFAKDEGLKSLSYSADNSFIPISRSEALHSDLSNDIFATLQVPSSSHHPESISPTAAFLMAFPLVSSLNGKTEVLEEEMKEDFKYRSHTPPMLLQIGAMEPNSFKLKTSASTLTKESLTAVQQVAIEAEKKDSQQIACVQKYGKSTTDNNKELNIASKISSDQSDIKTHQNLGIDSQSQNKTESRQTDGDNLKSLPKIIHSTNIKEQYKIVQTSIPLSLTTPIEVNNTYVYTSATSTVSYSSTPVITSCAPAQIQSTPAVHHNRPVEKSTQNIVAPILGSSNSGIDSLANLTTGINSSFQTPTELHTSLSTSVSKYDLRSQYTTTTQNVISNYPNIGGNVELPQYTPPTFTNTVHKTSSQNTLGNHVLNIPGLTNVSQASTQCHVVPKNHNYTTQNKDSHTAANSDQNSGANDSLRAKQQSQDHRHENYSSKKIGSENFGQNFSFNKDNVISAQNQGVQANQNVSMFQGKPSSVENYMPYSKESKKIVSTMTLAPSSGKPVLENTVHYSQNPMIPSSNYEHNAVTENNVKSTTTVTHNSSNFSISSWATSSSVGGNNNAMHYEQSQTRADNAENKTICENFGYVLPHKGNVGFSNPLPEFTNESGLNVNKLGNKPMLDAQKQPFIDQSKSQNIQTTITPQKLNQNPSVNYKFNNDNKSKPKYTIENNFMQSNYTNMEQQAKHQTLSNKQDKSSYPMPSYNPQALFNMPDVAPQVKYSTETYTGASFKYAEKLQQNQKYQSTGQAHPPPSIDQTNSAYKQTQNENKSKAPQIRAPVNWMMPEIKHTSNISDIILPPIGKELEYCQNNMFTQNTSYNQGTTNQFYNNYDATHGFQNMPVLHNEPKKVDAFYSEDQPFSWSPTKNTHVVEQSQTIKPIDQHIVPSTLPTLVGDLALGTNISEKQNFLFGQMSTTRISSEHNKDLIKEKDSNAGREYHNILNPQNGQQAAQLSFLSVSQLVENEKAEKSQQARKHQRKSTSPRGSGKRQLDVRKQTVTEQLHHDDQKSSVLSFPEQNFQQKYQQNDAHWRNRNCKSNYTAEALIGTNTNVQDENQQDKHAAIKFTPNYTQNKFSGALATDTMMSINYFPNTDDGNNYGQANQNFNSYAYSSNPNIYPNTNFISSMSNTPTSYMMPLHENSDYLETNSFLLPNAASSNPIKTQHYSGKHQNCDKRSYSTSKRSKRKTAEMAQNIDFPLSGINSPLEDYHSSFLPHANVYQSPPQPGIYPKTVNTNLSGTMTGNQNTVGSVGLPMNSNVPRGTTSNSSMVMAHPSGTSVANESFHMRTICPEINDQVAGSVAGYKPSNSMPPGVTQPTGHGSSYAQRTNYSNSLGHVPQVSEPAQFANNMPPSSSVHYKNS